MTHVGSRMANPPTFVELGAQVAVQDALLDQAKRFGARAYLSPGYDFGHWVGDEQHDGSLNGRIRGILVPRRVWTTSLDLLKTDRGGRGRDRIADGNARGLQHHRVSRDRRDHT